MARRSLSARSVWLTSLAAGCWLAVLLSARPASAQSYLGPNKCINCHDHEDEKAWWEKKDGPPPKGHINALNQMENKKSGDFAKAVGLADQYDPKGECVVCHATVFKGEANAGVSCEMCHGPGSAYLDPHQKKGAYQEALGLGMKDVVNKVAVWAPICMKCHVMDNAKLVAAGHPSGDDFDLGAKFPVVALHWNSKHDKATVTAEGRKTLTSIVAKRGGKGATATVPVNTPTPPQPTPTTPTPPTPPQPAGGGVTPPPPPPLNASGGAGPGVGLPPPSRPPGKAGGAPSTRPPVIAPPPVVNPPVIPVAPVITPDGTTLPSVDDTPPTALPRTPAAAVAAVQGRAIALLDALLRRGQSAPKRVVPNEPTTVYRGADADLLRLQEEILRLAIEALGAPPAKPQAK